MPFPRKHMSLFLIGKFQNSLKKLKKHNSITIETQASFKNNAKSKNLVWKKPATSRNFLQEINYGQIQRVFIWNSFLAGSIQRKKVLKIFRSLKLNLLLYRKFYECLKIMLIYCLKNVWCDIDLVAGMISGKSSDPKSVFGDISTSFA